MLDGRDDEDEGGLLWAVVVVVMVETAWLAPVRSRSVSMTHEAEEEVWNGRKKGTELSRALG